MTPRRAQQLRDLAFVCLVALSATTLLLALIDAQPPMIPRDGDLLPFLMFAALLIVAESQPRVRMRFGDHGEVSPGWAFAYALVLIGSPVAAVIIMGTANVYVDATTRKGVLRTVFNSCKLVVSLSLGGLALDAFGVEHGMLASDHLPVATALGCLVAGVVIFLASSALTGAALCLHHNVRPDALMEASYGLSLQVDAALLALAPVFVITIEYSVLLLPLLGISSFVVFQSARTALKREHEATHDSLTKLLNRRAFDERLDTAIERAEKDRHPLVLIMDLDRFKGINDRLGHPVGDKLLCSFAERLQRALPPTAAAARLGGDEFAAILDGVRSVEEAKGIVTRLHAQLTDQHQLSGFPLSVGVSIGAAMAPRNGNSAAALVAAADLAMYRAKQFGSGIEVAADGDNHTDVGRVGLLADLSKAIGTDQILVHYQPLLRLVDGAPDGVEALMRWNHPTIGPIAPSDFIGMTEETDLIGPLTDSMFRMAVGELMTLDGEIPNLSINIAARNLLDRQFAPNVLGILAEFGFPADLLELELTERDIVTNSDHSALTLARLREAGVRVAIDDFGTGYSSLLTLRDLRADRIKIDQSFTTRMIDSAADRLIVAKVIEIAHELGLDVVAEGVESEQVWQELWHLGCDIAQGYAIAKPMPIRQLEQWLWLLRHQQQQLGRQPARQQALSS
jgi:diguanylate cyclase (GGDEF)-like protein